jgi:hypothetical protein
MWHDTFTLTKRQLGWLLVIFGALALVAVLAVDFLSPNRGDGGIGPAQSFALIGAGAAVLAGLTLIPLGDQPA